MTRAPVVVALTRDYAEQVAYHLYGDVYLDRDVDTVQGALHAAAVTTGAQRHTETDLFGDGE